MICLFDPGFTANSAPFVGLEWPLGRALLDSKLAHLFRKIMTRALENLNGNQEKLGVPRTRRPWSNTGDGFYELGFMNTVFFYTRNLTVIELLVTRVGTFFVNVGCGELLPKCWKHIWFQIENPVTWWLGVLDHGESSWGMTHWHADKIAQVANGCWGWILKEISGPYVHFEQFAWRIIWYPTFFLLYSVRFFPRAPAKGSS